MLRTLHLTNAWHASSGGIGTFYQALLAAATPEWQVRLVVPGAESWYQAIGENAGIYHLRARRAPYSPAYRVLYPPSFLLPGSPIRRILGSEQPNVVEVNDKYTLVYLAGLLRIGAIREMKQRPAVVGISCERLDETLAAYTKLGGLSRPLARTYMKYIYFKQFDHHIAVSTHVAEELESVSGGHRIPRGVWIRGMGVDAARFSSTLRSAEARAELIGRTLASDPVTLLLYAGRLAPEKNLPLLLDTLSLLNLSGRFHLLISGDGPAREQFLMAANRRVPGDVTYLGHESDRKRLARVYANVDVFLHPNPREPFGIAPLEAMASAVPLVAPSSGGITEYANECNSWAVAATPQEFAWAVHRILQDPEDRRRRVRAAVDTAQRRDWPAVSESFHTLYRDIYLRSASKDEKAGLEPNFWSRLRNDMQS